MIKVHVFQHIHWDSEWYFTKNDTDVLLFENFKYLVNTLEKNKKYQFLFDAQTSPIKELERIDKQLFNRVVKLVNKKRLFFGPQFVQIDNKIPLGESIYKNTEYGIEYLNELGIEHLKVGYEPDTFGHNIQKPQILKSNGIDSFIFWRGHNIKNTENSSIFNWVSPAGDNVLSYSLQLGYGAGKFIEPNKTVLEKKYIPILDKIKKDSKINDILLPNGGDQYPLRKDIFKTLEVSNSLRNNYEWKYSTLDKFIKEIKNNKFPNYTGDLDWPYSSRIHRTIISQRQDIKALFYELEYKLINTIEPLNALLSTNKKYSNRKLIDEIWENLLYSGAHDSIGGCNSDDTNNIILNRLVGGIQKADSLINLMMRNFTYGMKNDKVIIWNGNNTNIFKQINISTIYENFELIDKYNNKIDFIIIEKKLEDGGRKVEVTSEGEKETKLPNYFNYKIFIKINDVDKFKFSEIDIKELDKSKKQKNNFKDIVDLKSKILKIKNIEPKLFIEGNNGDSYDFSRLEDKLYKAFEFSWESKKFKKVNESESIKVFKGSIEVNVPKDIDSWIKQENLKKQIFNVNIIQIEDKKVIINLDTNNDLEDVMVKIMFPYKNQSKEFVIKSQYYERIVKQNNFISKDWNKKLREYPISVYPMLGYLKDIKNNLTISSNTNRELTLENGNVYYSLYRSNGLLGRNDILWRPGRASGVNDKPVYTPDSQVKKNLKFNFAIDFDINRKDYDLDFSNSNPFQMSNPIDKSVGRIDRFEIPFEILKAREFSNNLYKLLENKDIIVTLIKEYKKSIIVRYLDIINWKINKYII